jgi:predicted Fe-Mo cluster-binding NifX family protein
MKYGIPTDDGATVSAVFGRAKSFAIYDEEASVLSILANEGASSEHGAGTGAAAFLAGKGVQAILAPEVGPKAAEALRAAGIEIRDVETGAGLEALLAGLARANPQSKGERPFR